MLESAGLIWGVLDPSATIEVEAIGGTALADFRWRHAPAADEADAVLNTATLAPFDMDVNLNGGMVDVWCPVDDPREVCDHKSTRC